MRLKKRKLPRRRPLKKRLRRKRKLPRRRLLKKRLRLKRKLPRRRPPRKRLRLKKKLLRRRPLKKRLRPLLSQSRSSRQDMHLQIRPQKTVAAVSSSVRRQRAA